MVVLGGVASASFMIPSFLELQYLDYSYPNKIQLIMIIIVSVVFGIPTLIAFLLIPCDLVIQYGMDQLHEVLHILV